MAENLVLVIRVRFAWLYPILFWGAFMIASLGIITIDRAAHFVWRHGFTLSFSLRKQPS